QDARAGDGLARGLERGVGRGDQHLAPGHVADALRQRTGERGRLGARAVHLPVAGEQRDPGHAPQRSRTFTPGSSRPSRNSSDAPPPVETCVTASVFPARASAATESPPPTSVTPRQVASASAIAIVPWLKGVELEDAHGPVPEHGLRSGDLRGVALRRLGADVDAMVALPSSQERSTSDTLSLGTPTAMPSSLPANSGITRPIALAAPVLVGIIDRPAARTRRRSSCGGSRMRWSLV